MRRHYPPLDMGRRWDPKLIQTVRAENHDPLIGDGEFAVVRDGERYDIWQNDERVTRHDSRAAALEMARLLAEDFDQEYRHGNALESLWGLTSEEMRRRGSLLADEDGEVWRGLQHVLCLPIETPLLSPMGYLRRDVRKWCKDQGIWIKTQTLTFAVVYLKGGVRVTVDTQVFEFRSFEEAMFFKFAWV